MLGRFIEGRYHLNAAVSLSISLGLHRLNIISSPLIGLSISNIEVPNFALSSVEDMSELHERVLLFWSVLTMDRSWSSAPEGISGRDGESESTTYVFDGVTDA